MKILAIQFRYLGDAVLLTPALRALKEHFAGSSLHVLVAEEVAPLLEHLPWVERVWSFPRRRGQANLRRTWPVLRGLRREQFDLSVDFAGGDRGALVSLLCGARERVTQRRARGFFGTRLCYTRLVSADTGPHQSQANFAVLSTWGIPVPVSPVLEVHADPTQAGAAEKLLPGRPIVCHVGTSQPKKDWPIGHWAEFARLAGALGHEIVFSAGPGNREQALLAKLKALAPAAVILPPICDLALFLAVLSRARLFVTGDTGPLHFAAGLGIPTLSLFGPSAPSMWAPLGPNHRLLQGRPCTCSGDAAVCSEATGCMGSISPPQVCAALQELLLSTATSS